MQPMNHEPGTSSPDQTITFVSDDMGLGMDVNTEPLNYRMLLELAGLREPRRPGFARTDDWRASA